MPQDTCEPLRAEHEMQTQTAYTVKADKNTKWTVRGRLAQAGGQKSLPVLLAGLWQVPVSTARVSLRLSLAPSKRLAAAELMILAQT